MKKASKIVRELDREVDALIRELAEKGGSITLSGAMKSYRIEKDGRIVAFSPSTGRIIILNPTMALIINLLKRGPLSSKNLTLTFLHELKRKGIGVRKMYVERDLRHALKFLFVHEIIHISVMGREYSMMRCLRQALTRENSPGMRPWRKML